MSITNPFAAAEATFNPGAHVESFADNTEEAMEQLNLGNAGVNTNTNLVDLAKILGGSDMSSVSNTGGVAEIGNFGLGSNPYSGQTGPVAGRQVVDYSPPLTSQPTYDPSTGTSRTMPSSGGGVTGGQEFDFFGNRVGNNFSVGSGTAGMFDSAGTNIGNFLSDTFGSSYNKDFGTTATTGLGSVNWGTKNRAFNFGGKLFNDGKGLQTPGWTKDALGFARAAGYDTSGINQGLGLANMTGNSLFDYAAARSGNPYVGMLNDDFSQRGIMSKALSFGKVPYAGGIMGAMDYAQGYNNYGALGSTLGGLVGGPLGAWAGGMLGRNATGFDDQGNFTSYINDNYSGAGRDYAEASGFKVGTPEFDYAIKGFESLQRGTKNTVGQQRLVDEWNTNYTDRIAAEQEAAATEEAARTRDYGQEGDLTSRQNGQTFHNGDYNWGSTESHDNTLSAGGYTWDGDQGSVAEMQEETGLGTQEWDSNAEGFSWGEESWESDGQDTGDGYGDADSDAASDMDSDSGWSGADSDFSDSGGGDSGGGGGGSYIATAATQALGEEGLTIFEEWRDYMFTKLPTFTTSYGRYRVTAPKIVKAIDKKKNAKEIYSYIWDMHLKPIFDLIREDKDSDKALKDYKKMVRELQNKFLKEKV